MRRCALGLLVLSLAAATGCPRAGTTRSAKPVGAPVAKIAGQPYGDFMIGNPVSYENLTIFPISSKTPKNEDRFITLDEGLASGTVQIIEVGGDQENSPPSSDDPFSGDSDDAEDSFAAEPSQSSDDPTGESNPFAFPTPSQGETDSAQVRDTNTAPITQTRGESPGEPPAAEPPVSEANEGVVEDEAQVSAFEEEEILEDDLVEVDGDVNTLLVKNTSGKPLYLMPGEVISGGKQDRTIGQEIVIASSDQSVPIDVFCVEQGRWAGRTVEETEERLSQVAEFAGNLSLVISQTEDAEELAKEARQGKFVASVGQVSKDVRLAVQYAKKQGKVWEEVSIANAKTDNNDSGGNFAANYVEGEIAKDFEPFIENLKPVGNMEQIVGVVVAVNGKMLSVDTFESTPLFKKFWPKLLKSYALDAVAAANSEKNDDDAYKSEQKPASCTTNECIAFLKDIEDSKSEMEDLADGQKIAKRESAKTVGFTYYDADAAEDIGVTQAASAGGLGGGGGGFGGGVHFGGFSR